MDAYKKLEKITRPVLIEVKHAVFNSNDRYRILFPDGSCIYDYVRRDYYDTMVYGRKTHCDFHISCFSYRSNNMRTKLLTKRLNKTIEDMRLFDYKSNLEIVAIFPL